MSVRRYLRLLRIFAGTSISAQLEYRVNFVLNLISSALLVGGSLLALVILYSDGQALGGWSLAEAMVIVGLFTLTQGFIETFLYPNLNRIAEAVRLGTMDFYLLKPIDAQFLVSTRNLDLFRIGQMLVGIGIISWAVPQIPGVTWLGGLLGFGLFVTAQAIVYAIWFMLSTTAFWFVKVENVTELFNGMFRAGQFPVSAFPGWVRFLFTFVVPVAFITTVPAEAIVGRLHTSSVLIALGLAAALLLVSRWFWSYAVRNYTSASS